MYTVIDRVNSNIHKNRGRPKEMNMNVKNVRVYLSGIRKKIHVVRSASISMLQNVEKSLYIHVKNVQQSLPETVNSKKVGSSVQSVVPKNMTEEQKEFQRNLLPPNVKNVQEYLSLSKRLQDTAQRSVVTVQVTNVVPKGKQEVYNFEVQGTHTYLVADGVVAHNCDTLSQLGVMDIFYPMTSTETTSANRKLKSRSIWGDIYEEDETDSYSSYT